MERDAGLLKLKRALPLPPGAYVLAKMMMAMLFAALTFTALLIAALLLGKLTLNASQLAALAVVMILGALPFCALGLFIGSYVSGSVAPAVANLVYLPMLWLGGLFIPLPRFLQAQAVVWPSFHLNQVATGVLGLKEFHFVPTVLSLAVLVGITVLFGGLAIHRLARKG
jgi:ABC-2 type transport system permease protein